MAVRLRRFVILMLVLFLSACVIAPPTGAPRISRLPAGEAVRLVPEAPKLSLDDLLAMRQAGAAPDAIIARFRSSGARFDLSPTQIVDWHGRGMPLAVLDSIAEDRERSPTRIGLAVSVCGEATPGAAVPFGAGKRSRIKGGVMLNYFREQGVP
jgi:hypothetical protein